MCASEGRQPQRHNKPRTCSIPWPANTFNTSPAIKPERYDAQADNHHGSEGNLHGGNDTFYGSIGSDKVYGGYGNDLLYGKDGNDELYGWFDNDTLSGGNGEDHLYGGAGNDQLTGGKDNDYLDGGTDHDRLYGQYGEDTLLGGSGNDRLFGGRDNDSLYGGSGDDILTDVRGRTYFVGGGGADTFVVNANQRGSVIRDFKDSGDKVELDFGDWNQQRALGIALSIEGNDFVYSANGDAIVTIKGAMNQLHEGAICVSSAEVGKSPDPTCRGA